MTHFLKYLIIFIYVIALYSCKEPIQNSNEPNIVVPKEKLPSKSKLKENLPTAAPTKTKEKKLKKKVKDSLKIIRVSP